MTKIKIRLQLIAEHIYNLFFPERNVVSNIVHALMQKEEYVSDRYQLSKATREFEKYQIKKIKKFPWSNHVQLYLMRPGMFIGKAGCNIDFIQKKTGYKIDLIELRKSINRIEREIDALYSVASYEEQM